MSSAVKPGSGPRLGSRRAWTSLLSGCVVVAAWVWAMNAAGRALSFEPNSDRAMREAADARLPGVLWGLVLVLAAVALAWASGLRWMALLGVPGLVVAATFLLAPASNGSALILGLAASLVVVATTVFGAAHHWVGRRRRDGS